MTGKFFLKIKVVIIIFLLIASSRCSFKNFDYANVTLHKTGDRESFIFSVSEEFLEKNQKSLKHEHKKSKVRISKIEYQLLVELLEKKKFCLNQQGKVDFEITSKQEKIYDMTFSHLIATSYKAKPLTALSYFGECKKNQSE
jgi:hypothetical protein